VCVCVSVCGVFGVCVYGVCGVFVLCGVCGVFVLCGVCGVCGVCVCVCVCGVCVCLCVFQHVLLGTPTAHYGHDSCHYIVPCISHRSLYSVP